MKTFIFITGIITVLFFGNNILAQEKPTPVHHSNSDGTIKQFIAKIPAKVQCYYYVNGKFITVQ
jgi:hypothetical protein